MTAPDPTTAEARAAAVLAEHEYDPERELCACGVRVFPGDPSGPQHSVHVAAALAAAGVLAGEDLRAAGVNAGVRIAADLVRDHILTEQGQRIAEFLEDRADRVMPAHVAARLAPASGLAAAVEALARKWVTTASQYATSDIPDRAATARVYDECADDLRALLAAHPAPDSDYGACHDSEGRCEVEPCPWHPDPAPVPDQQTAAAGGLTPAQDAAFDRLAESIAAHVRAPCDEPEPCLYHRALIATGQGPDTGGEGEPAWRGNLGVIAPIARAAAEATQPAPADQPHGRDGGAG